ncbi:LOW QUALITY PROTEIN: hypothetical protein U9M48_020353 [Paspalum notatum var. saurae]|uniref:HMA domain-containing protein n=1 Tax=Paspalum notatum var. saurae TaxID=547442 RepID=A0AAQ3WRL9_PASNO
MAQWQLLSVSQVDLQSCRLYVQLGIGQRFFRASTHGLRALAAASPPPDTQTLLVVQTRPGVSSAAQNKIVIKADLIGSKCKSEILAVVSRLQGIKSMEIDAEKCTLTVVGTVDPVCIVQKLNKKCFAASIVSVADDKPKEKDTCKEVCEKLCKEKCEKITCCKECKEKCEKECKEACEKNGCDVPRYCTLYPSSPLLSICLSSKYTYHAFRPSVRSPGIKSMTIDAEKCTLTVVGTVDPVCISLKLKKKCFATSIVSVEDDKPPAPKKEEKDPCKELCEKLCKERCEKIACSKECKELCEKLCKERCERRCKAWLETGSCSCRPAPGCCCGGTCTPRPTYSYCYYCYTYGSCGGRCGRGGWPGHFGC